MYKTELRRFGLTMFCLLIIQFHLSCNNQDEVKIANEVTKNEVAKQERENVLSLITKHGASENWYETLGSIDRNRQLFTIELSDILHIDDSLNTLIYGIIFDIIKADSGKYYIIVSPTEYSLYRGSYTDAIVFQLKCDKAMKDSILSYGTRYDANHPSAMVAIVAELHSVTKVGFAIVPDVIEGEDFADAILDIDLSSSVFIAHGDFIDLAFISDGYQYITKHLR